MIQLLVKNRAAVVIVTLAIVILGLSTYQELPREANPDVKVPVVMVTTVYPGVSPADIESLVTIPLESEISSVKDIKKLSLSLIHI